MDKPFPKVVRIEPASACNLFCSHCPTGTEAMHRGIMREDVFQQVLQELERELAWIKVAVLYHGGEPLLNKSLVPWIRSIKSLKIPFVKTVSNGMLLSREMAEKIATSGLDAIEFSLDGISAEENNALRIGCDYERVTTQIKYLMDFQRKWDLKKPRIFISNAQFAEVSTYALSSLPEIPTHLKETFSGEYYLEPESYKPLFIYRWPEMNSVRHGIYKYPDAPQLNYCDYVHNSVTIRWNGDVVACCYDLTSTNVLGNVMNRSIRTIWNSPDYNALRESIFSRDYRSICNQCSEIRGDGILLTRGNNGH